VARANFECLSCGGRVVLRGLTGAAHLNGTHGTLVGLKPGSLERVIVRVDGGLEGFAVKIANCSIYDGGV
jgi:hypothetical protein